MSLKKNHLQYFCLYLIAVMLLLALYYPSDKRPSLFISITSAFLPSIYVLKSFISDHKRAPDGSEQLRLTWGAIATVWGTSIGALALFLIYFMWTESASIQDMLELLSYLKPSTNTLLIVFIVSAFITAIYYIGFMYIYGKVAQQEAHRLETKNKL